MSDGKPIIVIKKKGGHGGHHGGAWKVAYADFVTAMMAFFMVMWLVNSADTVTKKSIASYFKKPGIFQQGSGTPLMIGEAGILQDAYVPAKKLHKGGSQGEVIKDTDAKNPPGVSDDKEGGPAKKTGGGQGPLDSDRKSLEVRSGGLSGTSKYKFLKASGDAAQGTSVPTKGKEGDVMFESKGTGTQADGGLNGADGKTDGKSAFDKIKEGELERAQLERAAQEIKNMVRTSPELQKLLGAVDVKLDSDGLNIEIMDSADSSMFTSGSARILPDAQSAFERLVKIVGDLPNRIDILGHTDGQQYPEWSDYSNWDLSADRANAARKLVISAGIPSNRINSVVGKADQELRLPQAPLSPSNRRITLKMRFKSEQNIHSFRAEDLNRLPHGESAPVETTPRAPVAEFEKTTPEAVSDDTDIADEASAEADPEQTAESDAANKANAHNEKAPMSFRPDKVVQASRSKTKKTIALPDEDAPPEATNNNVTFGNSPVLGPQDLF
jgi:chemotaxis protein MotB